MGVSVDSSWAHRAFREKLGITIPLLSDFEPKGEVIRSYGAYLEEAGHGNRSLVLVDADGVVRWVHESPTPLEIPGANLIFDALAATSSATRARSSRRWASPDRARRVTHPAMPPSAPTTTSAARGRRRSSTWTWPARTVRADLDADRASCRLRLVFRHFPGGQQASARAGAPRRGRGGRRCRRGRRSGRWWTRSIATRGRVDDPHLWERAGASASTWSASSASAAPSRSSTRVRRDFEGGIRAGVTGTPAAFVDGRPVAATSRRRCARLAIPRRALLAASVRSSPLENESSERRLAVNRTAGGKRHT